MNSKNILNSYTSPAVAYEISLTEISKSENSKDEKIHKVFEVLDELVPNLGVYASIMKIVRKQLFDAVFSDEFTADSSGLGSIKRISFYSLHKSLMSKKDEKYDVLQNEIKNRDIELEKKEIEKNELMEKIGVLNQSIEELNKTLVKFSSEIKSKQNEIKNFQEQMKKVEQLYGHKVNILESQIDDYKGKIAEETEVISELSKYKNSYDQIHSTFRMVNKKENPTADKKLVNVSRKNQILVDILNAKKLEEQIFTLINMATEEYDTFLEKQNQFLLEKFKASTLYEESYTSSFNTISKDGISYPFLNPSERNALNQQLNQVKVNYQRSIVELKNQHELTVQHRQSLEEKLYLLEADRETTEFMKRQKMKASQNNSAPSENNSTSSLQGLEEHYEPIRKGADKDPFAVQDRIFSRWACSLMTSTDGKIWRECKLVKFCENCGDKTLICPHKLSLGEVVVNVSEGTKMLRFSRPKLQYNQFMIKRSLDAFKRNESKFQVGTSSQTAVLTNYATHFQQDMSRFQNRESLNILVEGNSDIGMMHNFQRLWYDYSQRTTYKRQVPRPFTYERTISLLQQFLAYLHHKEVNIDENPKDIVNSLYDFFENRYEIEDVKYAAVFDFYSSLNFYAPKSMLIEVFCNVLIGNLDRAILNYIIYLAEIIDRVDWLESDDVKIFFSIIYPYCDDDELDTLNLEFVSFSENKINKKLVLEFIMTLIMKRKETIVNEMEFRLAAQSTLEKDYMNELEFVRAIEDFFMVADEKHTIVSYRTSLAHAAWDNLDVVPISKLAQIASYFNLIQLMNDISESISRIVNETRDHIKEKDAALGLVDNKSNQLIEYEGEFIKISEIDELSQALQQR